MSTFRGTSKVQAGTAGTRGTPRQSIRFATLLLAALSALALTVALTARAEAFVYWANPDEGTIGRTNLDGTGVDERFITGAVQPVGIAVNRSHIYWMTGGIDTRTIGRANLDGTDANPRFIVDGDVDPSSPTSSMAVDDQHVYWVSRFRDNPAECCTPKPGTGSIGRANVDGTGIDEDFITGVSFPLDVMAVDGSHLYWTNLGPDTDFISGPAISRIGRANLDGTGVEENFISENGVAGMAVDASHFYWLLNGFSRSEADFFWIRRANLDGTGVEDVTGTFTGGGCGVAIDDTHVYWAHGYPRPAIGRAKLDGSRVNTEFITATGGRCGGVAVDALGPHPSNEFGFGKVKKNKKKGTAKLTVKVPGPGTLKLTRTESVKGARIFADVKGKAKVPVKPRGEAKKKLNRKGKAKVEAEVTFTPDGGEPNTQSKRVRLIKRH